MQHLPMVWLVWMYEKHAEGSKKVAQCNSPNSKLYQKREIDALGNHLDPDVSRDPLPDFQRTPRHSLPRA